MSHVEWMIDFLENTKDQLCNLDKKFLIILLASMYT